jgi:dihydroorotase
LPRKTAQDRTFLSPSTAEMTLFTNKNPIEDKKITAEVCIHHLWFTNEDYETKRQFNSGTLR